MRKISPKKLFLIISSIISAIILIVAVFWAVNSNSVKDKTNIAIGNSYIAKSGYDLTKKVPDSNMNFEYNTTNKTAKFIGLNSFDKTSFTTLEIPEQIEKDGINYTVTSIGVEYTSFVYAPFGETPPSEFENGLKTDNIKEVYMSSLFAYGSYLTALVIPDTVTQIEDAALYGLASLEYLKTPFIGSNVGSLKPFGSMFSNGYYSVDEPNYTFIYMQNTTDVNTSTANHINVARKVTWYDKTDTFKLTYYVPHNLTDVIITKETGFGKRTFAGISSIVNLTLPDTLTTVGDYAFTEMTELLNINLPNAITGIPQGMLAKCTKVKKIILPNNISGIPVNVFGGCSALEEVYMPTSVTTIGDQAFEDCEKLNKIVTFYNSKECVPANYVVSPYAINLPSGLTTIGDLSFAKCSAITELHIPDNVTLLGKQVFGGMATLKKLYIPFVGAEQGNDGEAATMGYLFGAVDNGAKYQVTHMGKPCYIPASLEEIYVSGETRISTDAFKNMADQANITKGVKTIVINSGVNYIEDKAFEGCAALVNITLPFAGVYTNGSTTGSKNNKTSRYFAYIFGEQPLTGLEKDIITTNRYVPTSLKNIIITNQYEIYTGTFSGLKYIESVEIYPVTQYIDEAIFYANDSLQSLTMPFVGWIRGDWYQHYTWWYTLTRRNQFSWIFSETEHGNTYADESIRYYDSYIRYIPETLRNITVTDETYIGPYSFKNLSKVTNLTILDINDRALNNGISIAKGSCSGMSSLVKLSIPFIGQYYNPNGDAGPNHSLGWIFGDAVNSSYHYSAYQYNTTFAIPRTLSGITVEHISKIPNYSLANLTSLTSVVFSSPVTEVGDYAFYNDMNLATIDYTKGTGSQAATAFTKVGNYAFYNNQKLNYIEKAVPKYLDDKTITNQSTDGLIFGDYAFAKTGISTIDFTRIKSVGKYAFMGCLKIASVNVTSNVEVSEGLFKDCIYLVDFTLSKGKATAHMFENCKSLVNANVESGTTYEDITTAKIEYYIPYYMFKGCSSLIWGGIGSSATGLVISPYTTSIGEYAFADCESLTTFILPETTKVVGDYALRGSDQLSMIIIPQSVTNIGYNVFTEDIGNDFAIWVYEPKEKWPVGWTENWNCLNPVYVIPGIDDSMYEFEFSSNLRGYVITGIKDEFKSKLTGRINLPRLHNYVDVVGVASSVFKDESVKQIVVPSSIKHFGDNALSTGKRTDVYFETKYANGNNKLYFMEKELGGDYVIQEEYDSTTYTEQKVGVSGNEDKLTALGYVFYGDYWQYGAGSNDETNTPYLIANQLKFKINDTVKPVYSGNAWTPSILYIETKGVLVENNSIATISDRIESNVFNYSYKDNILAGKATVTATLSVKNYNNYILLDDSFRIAGAATFNFVIDKAPLQIYYSNENDNMTHFVTDYSENPYLVGGNWGNHNIFGLPINYVFQGVLSTRSADAGIYTISGSTSNNQIYWTEPYRVYLYGQDVTNNFEPHVYVYVEIKPCAVNLEWSNCEDLDNNGVLEYQYEGKVLKPTAIAKDLNGVERKNCIVDVYEYGVTGIYPYQIVQAVYTAKARISSASSKNYIINNPVSDINQNIQTEYIIVNRKLTVEVSDTEYLIPYNAESFSFSNWGQASYSDTSSIVLTGLQEGSTLAGEVVTLANNNHTAANNKEVYTTENNSLDFKKQTFILSNYLKPEVQTSITYDGKSEPVLPYLIYRYDEAGKLEIENDYYDVKLVASVRIVYNDFDVDYYVDEEKLTLGLPVILNDNTVYPTSYETDGANHHFHPVINNIGISEGDYNVTYDVAELDTTGMPVIKELGDYTIGVTITRKNFNEERKIIKVNAIKSNVKYDMDVLNKEYDGEPVPTFDKTGKSGDIVFITKKALYTNAPGSIDTKEQVFSFEYCDINKNVIPAPSDPGTYMIHITANETDYFNEINKYELFTISKRTIHIYVDHIDPLDPSSSFQDSYIYDGKPITFTIDTSVSGARGSLLGVENDGYGNDTRHQFKGTFQTNGQYPGEYSSDNNGFVWTVSWNVYSLQLGNISYFYKVEFHNSITIAQKEITWSIKEPYKGPFDGIPHGLEITVSDPNPASASILYTLEEANEDNDGEGSQISWSSNCPQFTEPGTYQIWFKIIAGVIPNTEGKTAYKTVYKSATIEIYNLEFEIEDPVELKKDIIGELAPLGVDYYIDYDAEEHELEVIVTNHPTPKIYYKLYQSTFLIYEGYNVPKVVEPGDNYTLVATISADFYTTKEVTYKFAVTDHYLSDAMNAHADDVEVIYNGEAHSINVVVTGLPEGTEYKIKYLVDMSTDESDLNPGYTDVCDHIITYIVFAKGYKVRTGSALLIIQPASLEGKITVKGYNDFYTGTPHKLEITGIPDNTDATIYYTDLFEVTTLDVSSTAWFTDPDKFAYTNVMDAKTIYFRIVAKNYVEYSGSGVIKINKVTPTVTYEDKKEIQYTGVPLLTTQLEIDTIHDGLQIIKYYNATVDSYGNFTYDAGDLIDAPIQLGTYYFVLEYKDTNNCYPITVEGGFKIVPRVVELIYNKEVEYNGLEQGPDPIVKTGTKDVLYVIANRKDGIATLPIEIGEYEFVFSFSETQVNYELAPEDQEILFKITKRKLLVKFEDGKKYKANELWTRADGWDQFGFTNKLLTGHTFESLMSTNSYARATYVYSTLSTSTSMYVVQVTGTKILDSEGVDVTDLYDISYDIIVKIYFPAINYQLVEYNGPYDGKPHTIEFEFGNDVDPSQITIWYNDEDGIENGIPWSQLKQSFTITNVGSRTIYYRLESDVYENVENFGTVTIVPANLDIEIAEYSEEYDASNHYVSFDVTNVYDIDKTVAKIDYYPIESVTLEELTDLYNDFDENNSIYTTYRQDGMLDAGQYYAVVHFFEESNYQNWYDSYAIKIATVNQKGIYLDLITSRPLISSNYNGIKYGQNKPYILLGDALFDPSDLVPGHTMVYATKYENTSLYLANKNYSVRTVSPNAGYYYGEYYVDMFGEVHNSHGYEFNNIKIIDSNKKDVSSNYYPIFDENDLIVRINRVALPKFDVKNPDYKYYDGLPAEPKIEDNLSDGKITYKYYKYGADGKLIPTLLAESDACEVGKYRVEVSIADGTNYYAWPSTETSEYEILPLEVDVQWENLEVTFNGEYQSPKAYYIDVFGIQHYLNVHMFNVNGFYDEIVNAGVYEAYVIDDPTILNYSFINTNVLFTINKYEYNLNVEDSTTITDRLWSMQFDENDLENFIPGLTITNSAENDKAKISTISSTGGYYLGNDKFVLDILITTTIDSTKIDVTNSILFNIVGTVQIITHEILFDVDDVIEIEYDGLYHLIDDYVKVNNPGKDSVVITYNWSTPEEVSEPDITNLKLKDVNTYEVTFTISASGYDPVEGKTTVNIKSKKSYINFTYDNLNREYNGQEITAGTVLNYVSGEWNNTSDTNQPNKEDLTVTFYEYGQSEPMTTNPVDRGIYEAVITCKLDNVANSNLGYTTLNESVVFEITPKVIKVAIDASIEIVENTDSLDDLNWTYNNGTFNESTGLLVVNEDPSVKWETSKISNVLLFEFDGQASSKLQRGTYYLKNHKLSVNEVVVGETITYDTHTTLFEDLGFVWNVKSSTKTDALDKYLDVTKNYTLDLDLNLAIHLPYMEVNIPSVTVSYAQGNYASTSLNFIKPSTPPANYLQYYATSETDLHNYSNNYPVSGDCWNDIANVKFEMPGTYKIFYMIDADGYEPATGDFTIKIEKYTREIAFIPSQKIYDGQPFGTINTKGSYIPNYTYTEKDLPDFTNIGDNMVVKYQPYGTSLLLDQAIDAGDYYVYVSIPESDNYLEYSNATNPLSIRITRRAIYVSGTYNAPYTGGKIYYNNFLSDNGNYSIYLDNGTGLTDITNSQFKIVATIFTSSATKGVYSGADTEKKVDFFVNNGRSYYVYYDGKDETYNYNVILEGVGELGSDKYCTPAVINVTPGAMTVSISGTTYEYDGTKKYLTIDVKNPSNESTVIYYSSDGENYSTTPIGYTEKNKDNANGYLIYIKITSPNFDDYETSAYLKIKEKTTVITFDVIDRKYDGYEVQKPTNIVSNYPDGYLDTEKLQFIFYKKDNNGLYQSIYPSNPVNAGDYMLQIIDNQPADSNYTGGSFTDYFTIDKMETSLQWSGTDYVYDGLEHKPTATLTSKATNDSINIVYTPTKVLGGDLNSIAAGSYLMTATLEYTSNPALDPLDNYNIDTSTLTHPYEILQREITIMLNQSRKFTGNKFVLSYNEEQGGVMVGYTVSNIIPTHTFAGSTLNTKTADVGLRQTIDEFEWKSGSTTNPNSYAIIDTVNAQDVTANYVVKTNINFLIDYNDLETAHLNYVGKYDGLPHSATPQVLNLSTVKYSYCETENGTYVATKPVFTNVGVYKFWILTEAEGYNSKKDEVTVTIEKKDIGLDFENPYIVLTKNYDGIPVVNPAMNYVDKDKQTLKFTYTYYRATYDIDGEPLRDANNNIIYDTLNPVSNPSFVGYYKLVVTIQNPSDNYTNATASREFRIKKVDLTIQFSDLVTTNYQTKGYDGYRWSKNLTSDDLKLNGLVSGETIQGKVQTTLADVGHYNKHEMFQLTDNFAVMQGASEVTSNYNIYVMLDVEITLANIQYTASDYETDYDAKNHNIIVNVTKPTDGYLIEYSTDGENYKPTISIKNTGEYTVYYRITAPNYKQELGEKKLTINGVDITADIDYTSSYEYSGLAYGTEESGTKITINTISNGEQTIKYYLSDGVTEIEQAITPGTYKFKVHVAEFEGFNEINATRTFVITPKKTSLIWENTTFTYDGNSHLPTRAYFVMVDGVTEVDAIINTDDAQTDAGTYVAHAEVVDEAYYSVSNTATNFTIKQLEIEIPEIANDMAFTYKFSGTYLDANSNEVAYSYGDDIVVKDIYGNIYELTPNGDILSITYINNPNDNSDDIVKVVGVDIEPLPYIILLDADTNADGVKSSETDPHELHIALTSPNYCWKDLSDDKKNEHVIVTYNINPYDFSDGKTQLEVVYIDDYYQIVDGNEKKPEIKIVIKNSDNIVIKELLSTAELPNYQEYEIYSYENNIEKSTKDNPALINIKGINNFSFELQAKFEIVDQPPTLLTLKNDATVQFVKIDVIDNKVNVTEDGTTERKEAFDSSLYNKDGLYTDSIICLGHLHQSFTKSYILSQFNNENLRIFKFGTNGETEVLDDDEKIGTNYIIKLYDNAGKEIDSIITLVFGDLDGNGAINLGDVTTGAQIFSQGYTYADLGIFYVASITKNRDKLKNSNMETLSSQASYFVNGDADDHFYDFNKNFLVKI